jgi:hypothetical protein
MKWNEMNMSLKGLNGKLWINIDQHTINHVWNILFSNGRTFVTFPT